MIQLVHFYPDRDNRKKNDWADIDYWNYYTDATHDIELEWRLAAHDAIDIVGSEKGYEVYVEGELVTPENTIFNTDIYGLPHQHLDVWQQLTTFLLLENAGFYLPVPPVLSCLANDKLLTNQFFKDTNLKLISTLRINTGRNLEYKVLNPLIEQMGFPMIVKPASWGAGVGVIIAQDYNQLQGILGLASASDVTMVLQPLLNSTALIDFRVYIIDGKPHTVMARRASEEGGAG